MENRSEFVTVVAWIFIILSGIGILIFGSDGLFITMLPFGNMMTQHAGQGGVPPISSAFITTLLRWMFAAIVLLQVWVLASSIGLLLRKNWARISFLVCLVVVLIWNGLGVLASILGLVGIHSISRLQEAGMPPDFQPTMRGFMVFWLLMTIAFMVLFGWILKRLTSENIRREFVNPADPSDRLPA